MHEKMTKSDEEILELRTTLNEALNENSNLGRTNRRLKNNTNVTEL